MIDTANINPLSDFNRNSREHIERLMKSGQAEVLTVNGKAAVVVQDAKAYQDLLRKADYADTVEAIRIGMAAHKRGEGIPIEEVFNDIAKRAGISLED